MKQFHNQFKFAILIMFLLFNSGLTSAQSREELKAKLKTKQSFDERLRTYTALFNIYSSNDLDSAAMWIDKAVTFVGDKKWPKYYREAVLKLATQYNLNAEYKKGAKYARYMSDHFKQHGNSVDQFKALDIQATVLAMHGNFDESLSLYKRIKTFLDKTTIPDKIKRNDCYGLYYLGLGRLYSHQNKHSYALKNVLTADSIFQTGGTKHHSITAKIYLGNIYGVLGDPKSAIVMLKEVEQMYNDGNKSIQIQSLYSNLASYYILQEDFENAEKYLRKSMDHGYKDGSLRQIGYDNYYMGSVDRKSVV